MALDFFNDCSPYEVLGAYFSPVSDAYAKPGLAPGPHRVRMCELAVHDSTWIMVDPWESSQPKYMRTASVLDHFQQELNGGEEGGCTLEDGTPSP
jgi:nicotinamide mononucleotide adenylyltransferase